MTCGGPMVAALGGTEATSPQAPKLPCKEFCAIVSGPSVTIRGPLCDMIERSAPGEIIEVEAGLLHSSAINPNKPINWRRIIEIDGEYEDRRQASATSEHVG